MSGHLDALKGRGIAVTNTPDVLSDATAELAMLLMLGAARHAVAGDRIVRTGKWNSWSPAFMVGKQVTGARLGIIGMGRVGQAFAAKARGFDMDIHYYNRTELDAGQAHGATYHIAPSVLGQLGVTFTSVSALNQPVRYCFLEFRKICRVA